ncbi:MAG: hypothetical protein IIB58_11710 [Planctomycetes bacterium]|nr:hypothetical protein [Planctomycetota bacterium]
MEDEPAYIVDIEDLQQDGRGAARGRAVGRRWLGIRFDCCNTYSRMYRNTAGTAYVGRCPKCTRRLSVPIGPGGTPQRFFRAS